MDIALFSPSSLFADSDGEGTGSEEGEIESNQNFEERRHQFPGVELLIREFSFHQLNANLLWPGTFAFIEWLVHRRSWMDGRKVIELGSGTGALAIFLHKSFEADITTSDYDDAEIEENIAYNCQINGVTPVLPHVRHSWGDEFPISNPKWDLIIASDILLYVKQYSNLIKSLSFLLKSCESKAINAISSSGDGKNRKFPFLSIVGFTAAVDKLYPHVFVHPSQDACLLPRPAFLMSWRRRIGKEDESMFFTGCEKAGLAVDHLGSRVYCITPKDITTDHST